MAAPLPEEKPKDREFPWITKPFTTDNIDNYEKERYEQDSNSVSLLGIDV